MAQVSNQVVSPKLLKESRAVTPDAIDDSRFATSESPWGPQELKFFFAWGLSQRASCYRHIGGR
jgi:hypothetical protein